MSLVKFEKKKHWQWFIFFISMYTIMVWFLFYGTVNFILFGILGVPIEPETGLLQLREVAIILFIPIAVAIGLMIFKKHNYGIKVLR